MNELVNTLTVELGPRSYPIHIGADLLGRPELLQAHVQGRQVCVITNETIAPRYLETVLRALDASRASQASRIILPDGEEFKTLETASGIYDRLLENKFGRDGALMALGGGVIGDMAGFAAATYQRGVDFIQLPTTLLAQVDSSVGGKTSVNRPLGKNMVGAFHQPICVLADTSALQTLPPRELRAGLAEVIKYGLIGNADFYAWITENLDKLLTREPQALAHAIQVSCREKAQIVAQDEKEGGRRAILNFGHTFGHAIETFMGYGKWLHGEAVAAGMALAARLSFESGLISQEDLAGLKALLQRASLPVEAPPALSAEELIALMSRDKKVQAGKIRFILLDGIGKAFISDQVDPSQIRDLLRPP